MSERPINPFRCLPQLKTYPGVDRGIRGKRFVRTGEFRAPRKGEFFLSGSIPEVYVAPTDEITTQYQIMRMVGSADDLGDNAP